MFNGKPGELRDIEEGLLFSHVAVPVSPPHAVHALCTPCVESSNIDQRLRWQVVDGVRLVERLVGCAVGLADGVWQFISMVLQWCSRVVLIWFLWRHRPSLFGGQSHSLFCLVDHQCRYL